MALRTPLCERLGITHPVLLAPMAGVAGGALAAAVTKAGGLGFIGGGYGDADWLAQELRAAGNTRIGIGFITWTLEERPQVLDMALAHKPAALFLSFGDLTPYADKIKAAGITLIAQVQTVRDAKTAMAQGADIIVAQGSEAGGHGAARGAMALVPAVKDALGNVPILAAGGIADGRGLAAGLMLGADGVVMGTAFYAALEALSHETAKAIAVKASGDDTARSNVFDFARGLNWPKPWTLRALRNGFYERFHQSSAQQIQTEQENYAQAAAKGDFETAAVIVGEAVDQITAICPAAEILEDVVTSAQARLRSIRYD